ncbi:MAG: hypothetical protein KVP17_004280 [Porospora cf. gigantea B]|uniref:uncharacterized protein n=2 Tax=Porospora cf. gigantea B TaxID=2853592 RepID=UPI003571B96E|nr:MAG: hypothetical protein KVP17_004280 [Porospora cf. gigantea B]
MNKLPDSESVDLIGHVDNGPLTHVTADLAQLQPVVDSLAPLDETHRELEREYYKEFNELRLKYTQNFSPLYQQRAKLLRPETSTEFGTPAIPSFWLTAMKNHPHLADHIQKHDEVLLRYLEDITFHWSDDLRESHSFTLTFQFSPNPFFSPEKLTKEYIFCAPDKVDLSSDLGEDLLSATKSSVIQWNAGCDVTERTQTRRQKNKKTLETRVIAETVRQESFFTFFVSHDTPSREVLAEMSDDALRNVEAEVENNFEIGIILRDRIIPRAVGWYLGVERDYDYDSSSEASELSSAEEEEDDDEPKPNEQECKQQ